MSNNIFKGKNDIAWEKLFKKYEILEEINKNNYFKIKSSQIKEFNEPRLMTKFDHKKQLPQLFIDNNLAILPLTRGSYIISEMETYHDFETQKTKIRSVEFPANIQSIDINNITSEATAINIAHIAGMVEDFTGEASRLTVSGRMSSGEFSFNIFNRRIDNFSIDIKKSQIEIDAGFETDTSLLLFEVKNSVSDDFLIRQLYYPYRLWQAKIQKQIRSIYMIYSNGIFTMYEYKFEQIDFYNSTKLIKKQAYKFEEEAINIQDITSIASRTSIIPEPTDVPFPQADNFSRVVNLCEMLFEFKTLSKDYITINYDFDARQTDYYANAAIYLGLIVKSRNQKNGTIYQLSGIGNSLFNKTIRDRNLTFVELILSHKVFKDTFIKHIEESEMPAKEFIVQSMKESKIHNVTAEETFKRRTSTVISWINWILELIS